MKQSRNSRKMTLDNAHKEINAGSTKKSIPEKIFQKIFNNPMT